MVVLNTQADRRLRGSGPIKAVDLKLFSVSTLCIYIVGVPAYLRTEIFV